MFLASDFVGWSMCGVPLYDVPSRSVRSRLSLAGTNEEGIDLVCTTVLHTVVCKYRLDLQSPDY